MAYLLLYGPVIINLLLIPKADVIAIVFIPVSLLIGGIIYSIYCSSKASNAKKKGQNDEYLKYKREKDITRAGITKGVWDIGKGTKDTVKHISDVDHWKKF